MSDKPKELLKNQPVIKSTLPRVLIVTQSPTALTSSFMKPQSAYHEAPESALPRHLRSIAKNLSQEMYGDSSFIPFHDLYPISKTLH